MKRSIIISVVVLASACGMNQEDARATWGSVKNSLNDGSGNSTSQALSIAIGLEADCKESGDMKLTAKLGIGEGEEYVPDGADAAFGYEIEYNECQPDENTLDGRLDYAALLRTPSTDGAATAEIVYVYQGTVVISGEENGECDIDVQGHVLAESTWGEEPGDEFDASVDMEYEGTICGQDAHEALDADASSDDRTDI